MNYLKVSLARNLFFCLFCVICFAANVTAQNPQAQPQPVLFDSWTKYEAPPSQTQVLASKVANSKIVITIGKPDAKISARFNIQPTEQEKLAFDLINEQRRLNKLSPLVINAQMLYLARLHSQNMADKDFFSHTGKDGLTIEGRANNTNLDDWSAIGENIAFVQGAKNPIEAAVEGWKNSPKHRINFLSKEWKSAAVGIAKTADGKFYLTQVFRN